MGGWGGGVGLMIFDGECNFSMFLLFAVRFSCACCRKRILCADCWTAHFCAVLLFWSQREGAPRKAKKIEYGGVARFE